MPLFWIFSTYARIVPKIWISLKKNFLKKALAKSSKVRIYHLASGGCCDEAPHEC